MPRRESGFWIGLLMLVQWYHFVAHVGVGQSVDGLKAESPDDKRFANIGNRLFADMKLTILLNYRAKKLTFYGSCSAP
jgi:hypothetical protein